MVTSSFPSIVPSVLILSDNVFVASFSPDGRHVATGSVDKNVYIWSVSDGKKVRVRCQSHRLSLMCSRLKELVACLRLIGTPRVIA